MPFLKGKTISSLAQLLIWCTQKVDKRCLNETLSVNIIDDIALATDTGFAHFQVIATVTDQSLGKEECSMKNKTPPVLSSGLVRVRFAPQSTQLTSIELCSYELLDEKIPAHGHNNGSAVPMSSCIYPSVVSLDRAFVVENTDSSNNKDFPVGTSQPSLYTPSQTPCDDETIAVGMAYDMITTG